MSSRPSQTRILLVGTLPEPRLLPSIKPTRGKAFSRTGRLRTHKDSDEGSDRGSPVVPPLKLPEGTDVGVQVMRLKTARIKAEQDALILTNRLSHLQVCIPSGFVRCELTKYV
jgi:hypothetical protein